MGTPEHNPGSSGAGQEPAPTGAPGLVERFDHVAMAVHDIERALPLLELIGAEFRKGGDNGQGDFRWCQFALPGSGTIELIQPLSADPTHFLNRFLDTRGEGLHHLTFKVADLAAAMARARDLGFDIVGVADQDSSWKEAFVHPRSSSGVLVQLAEWDDGPDAPDATVWDVLRDPPD